MYPLASRLAAELILHDADEPQNLAVFHANVCSISVQAVLRFVVLRMIRRNKEYHGNYPDDCGNDKVLGANYNSSRFW